MVHEYQILNINQAVELGTTLSRSWFRGHSRIFNELTPRVFREEYENPFSGLQEFSFAEYFKAQSPAYASHVPRDEEHLEWLFLMQHHGLPTRLLDWSQSVLVALYFVVREHFKDDGELWVMYPGKLNIYHGYSGIAVAQSEKLKYLAAEIFQNNSEKLAKDLGLGNIVEYPMAFYPPMRIQRMINQLSVFTIHPKPQGGKTIPELLDKKEHLIRYIIPSKSKIHLKQNLMALGIAENTLFADLDSLSKAIIEEHNVVGYNPPDPPKWTH